MCIEKKNVILFGTILTLLAGCQGQPTDHPPRSTQPWSEDGAAFWEQWPQSGQLFGPPSLDIPLESDQLEEDQDDPPAKSQDGRYVYLTFDDGPTRNTASLLDILQEHQVPATFFVIGHSILNRPDSQLLLNRALEEGHAIGLHSMTHDFQQLYQGAESYRVFYGEMREVQELVYQLTGYRSSICRPPFGSFPGFSQDHVDKIVGSDFRCWDWNIDTRDWQHRSVEAVMAEIQDNLAQIQEGEHLVILLHEGQVALDSLPDIIQFFQERDYSFLPFHPANFFPLNFLKNPDL